MIWNIKSQISVKKGVTIILLRNIDKTLGLCNRTRLIIQDLANNVIGSIVVIENHIGDKIYISQMNIISSDLEISLRFQR